MSSEWSVLFCRFWSPNWWVHEHHLAGQNQLGLSYIPSRFQIYLRGKIPLCWTVWEVSMIRRGFSLNNFTPPSYPSHLFPSEIYLILLEKENWSRRELFQHLLMLNHDFISPVLFTLQDLAIPSKTLNCSCLLLIKTQLGSPANCTLV